MKFQKNFVRIALLSVVFILMNFIVNNAQSDDEFSFNVYNNTKSTIKKLPVSEDGKNYGYFDISNGIAPSKSATLVWDKSINDQNCIQYFKAVYANGNQSKAAKFDFCEEELELVFDN